MAAKPALSGPFFPPNLKAGLMRSLKPSIKTQGGVGSASTILVQLFEPQTPFGLVKDDIYLRVRATNMKSLANSTNATIAVAGGCTVQETHTSSKDLTLKSCVLTQGTGTLTSNNTNVSDGDTVTIDTKVYTFKTSLGTTEGQVHIGGSADASLLNLINAINHTGTPGTDYFCALAHPTVSAAAAVTSHAFLVTARLGGSANNSIATTKSATTLSWGATTLLGGLDQNPGVIQFTVTDATAETISLRFGRPLVGEIVADYSQKQDLTHA